MGLRGSKEAAAQRSAGGQVGESGEGKAVELVVAVCGSVASGKTSICRRFVENSFVEEHSPDHRSRFAIKGSKMAGCPLVVATVSRDPLVSSGSAY